MNNLQNQNLNQISIMNQKYYKKQIAVLEKHKLVYVPVYLAYTYDDELGKFKKGKPQGLGAYANMRRKTVPFEYEKHNAVCVMMGENYDGVILVDIDNCNDDNDRNTMEVWNELMLENGLCDTLQSETVNGGMHYYFYCTEEQRTEFKRISFTSSNHKLFGSGIDIKYTNQLSYECSSIDRNGQFFKYEFVDDFAILPLPEWIYQEILRVKNRDQQKNVLTNYISRNTKPIDLLEEDDEYDINLIGMRIRKIEDILNILPEKYYDDYDHWCRVGFMVKSNKDLSDTQNFKLFLKFSKKSAKFSNEGDILRSWNTWKDGKHMGRPLTIATLYALGKKLSEKNSSSSDSSLTESNDEVIIGDDKEGADKILSMVKDTVIKSNKQIFLRKGDGNIYEVDESKNNETTKNYLLSAITGTNMCVQRGKNVVPYSKNASGAKNILTFVIPNLVDDTATKSAKEVFATKLWKSNLLKLCFLDGYYDFKDSTFKPYDNDTYSTICIKRKFPRKRNEAVIKEIYEKVLNKTFQNQEQLKYFLHWCARSIAGHVEDKSWSTAVGNRNSGKGVLYTMFKSTFEDYVSSFNAGELIIIRVGDGDVAKKLAWMIPLQYKRLCFSNEIQTHDHKGNKLKLDGAIIKKLSGGGDELIARLNYKEEISFLTQAHLMFMSNDMIEVAPSDALSTVNVFDFESEFVMQEELTEEQKQINATTNYKFYLADPDIKTNFLSREDVIEAFFHIVLDHYSPRPLPKPAHITNNVHEMLDCSDKEKKILLEKFAITRNVNDFLPLSDFNVTISECRITKAKAKLLLRQMGVVEKQHKIKGHNMKCYQGILRKEY